MINAVLNEKQIPDTLMVPLRVYSRDLSSAIAYAIAAQRGSELIIGGVTSPSANDMAGESAVFTTK
ncbi:hypothetical protein SJI19_06825 [Acerihabitans sp. TG2]|uniref:hypothetical protein n=1 Tax=Acerihabitans sp. TG2 TaxID=3096008 RepID=UPI002B226C5E|nr:hypothetical protein [Acerihabitans sp. TG2]MEA9390265.1 hypothetical protein [Acerihabitans sp. TG2]